jgi:hypothetical protein
MLGGNAMSTKKELVTAIVVILADAMGLPADEPRFKKTLKRLE